MLARAELSRILKSLLPKPLDSSDLQMSRQILVLAYTGRKNLLSLCLAGQEERRDFKDTSLTLAWHGGCPVPTGSGQPMQP